MKISDLDNIVPRYRSVKEWVDSFPDEERVTINKSLIAHNLSDVYEILIRIEGNRFPFTKGALAKYANRLKYYEFGNGHR